VLVIAQRLRARFSHGIDSFEAAFGGFTDDELVRREVFVGLLEEKVSEILGSSTNDIRALFTPLGLATSAACRLAGVTPSTNDWLAVLRSVLGAGPSLIRLGACAPVLTNDAATFFRNDFRRVWSNWRRVVSDISEHTPGATGLEQRLGQWAELQHRVRAPHPVYLQSYCDLVREAIPLRDRELRMAIGVGLRYLAALALASASNMHEISDPAIATFCQILAPLDTQVV